MILLVKVASLLLVISLVSGADPLKFCDPYVQNIPPAELPKLSKEFQTRVQLNLPRADKQKSIDILMLYDWFDKRAELVADENVNGDDELATQAFYYDKNEIFTYEPGKVCDVTTLNETVPSRLFFGLTDYEQGGIKYQNMDLPKDVLHFRNEYPHFKANRTTFRGIPVDHYKSCQYWPSLKANYHIDYFFTVPEFKQGVAFEEGPIPVAAIIQGYVDIDADKGTSRLIRNEYNYFRYRSSVSKRTDIFSQHPGYYCERQKDKIPIPQMPDTFTYSVEYIDEMTNIGATTRVTYSYGSAIIEFEQLKQSDTSINIDNVKIVNDYNSGIAYTINKKSGSCEMQPIGVDSLLYDAEAISTGPGVAYRIKTPMEMFHLDDTYFFAGQRYDRGRLCNVLVSKRTDYKMPGLDKQPSFWLFESYFKALENSDQGIDGYESTVPVTLIISAPGFPTRRFHFYDFDTTVKTSDTFDITTCYKANQKKEFAIRYNYPKLDAGPLEFDAASFKYSFELRAKQSFYYSIISSLSQYNYSPFRVIPPKMAVDDDGFTVYTGFTDRAEDILHFTKTEKSRCDISKAKNTVESSSAEECAKVCLDSAAIYDSPFRCLSFDFCSDEKRCSFYNSTHISDPSVVISSAPLCDHYSKTVDRIDSVSKEVVYRLIEDKVIRGEFDINVMDGDKLVMNFPAVDVYPANYEAEPEKFQLGTASFFNEFLVNEFDTDFNVSFISMNSSHFIRERKGVTINECARLCLTEPAFQCESMTYRYTKDCKWSSLTGEFGDRIVGNNNFISQTDFTWYTRDALYDYTKFEDQTSSVQDAVYTDVSSASECARACSKSDEACRSFNLCKIDKKLKCYISSNHMSSSVNDPSNQFSPICDHYSRNTLNDFTLLPQILLNTKPVSIIYNTSVQTCAQSCTEADTYICLSFDFISINGTCNIYDKNLKSTDSVKTSESSHYTRIYFEENGVDAKSVVSGNKEYSSATIFFVTLITAAIGIASGVVLTVIITRFTRKPAELPSMEFINPNYVRD